MADVTNELIHEVLKRIQHDISEMRQDLRETKVEVNAIRGHLLAIQGDTSNLYGILARQDQRLDRIERRLELRELAEPQHPFEPHP